MAQTDDLRHPAGNRLRALRGLVCDRVAVPGETEEASDRRRSSQRRRERWREIGLGAQSLRDRGVPSIRLIATQRRQHVGLAGFGIAITETETVES